MSASTAVRVCEHGNAGSCPHDYLCQMRLGKTGDDWQTHTVVACDRDPRKGWAQVTPLLRRRNYTTRIVRVGDLDNGNLERGTA